MANSRESKTAFVVGPIGSTGTDDHRRYRLALDYIVRKALVPPAWKVVRADDESSPDSITTQIIGRIVESDLVVVDLSDHNPNVFYELAVAHGYQKPVVHLMQDGQRVPFDVGDQRVIFYDLTDPESVDQAQSGLLRAVEWLTENPGRARNPLTAYGQFTAIRAGNETDGGVAVAEALDRLSRRISRLETHGGGRPARRAPRDAPAIVEYSMSSQDRKLMNDIAAAEERVRQLAAAGKEETPEYRRAGQYLAYLLDYSAK